MRILVVGASGLIGSHVAAHLLTRGYEIVGAARDVNSAARRQPAIRWVRADLAAMTPDDWRPMLDGVEAVVNCAGALQDGPRDDLEGVHVRGLSNLAAACVAEGLRRFVHISAAGADRRLDAFSRTKHDGETVLSGFDLDWVVLRPALVLAPQAYGGSALLRGLAAFPGAIPAIHAAAIVQVVSVEDVAEAVAVCIRPDGPARIACDLAAPAETSLGEVLTALRAWLGLRPAPVLSLPAPVGRLGGWVADGLALLGWRSPMRSTTLGQLAAGVRGRAKEGPALLALAPKSLARMLGGWPAGVQERWFARLYFLKPLALVTLAGFWVTSGLVGLARADAAQTVLTAAGMAAELARDLVIGGAIVDLALGLLVCLRRTAGLALLGMIAVSLAYLAGATVWRPDLWGDPLGPLVKTVPAIVLALVALAMLEER